MKKIAVLYTLLAGILMTSCSSSRKLQPVADQGISSLRFINEYIVPHGMSFGSTTVGGLSGIDYCERQNFYYLICDDRSERNPARFYKASIAISEKGIDSVHFLSVDDLTGKGLSKFPPRGTDPEAIRYNPGTREIVWTSEGERVVTAAKTVLQDPSVNVMDASGNYRRSLELPSNMKVQSAEKGPRDNGVFEGMSFADNYKYLFVSMEEPLYEDGARAATGDSSAMVRFLKFDYNTNTPLAQYAYRVDPVAYPPNPAGKFKINGIPDILYVGNNRFIVIERSFSTGKTACTIKIYLADISNATDISGIASLSTTPVEPIPKKLLLNMDQLGRYIDNIEGVSFGPKLSNGHRSLIFVADDNFSKEEKMQFLLFEIIP